MWIVVDQLDVLVHLIGGLVLAEHVALLARSCSWLFMKPLLRFSRLRSSRCCFNIALSLHKMVINCVLLEASWGRLLTQCCLLVHRSNLRLVQLCCVLLGEEACYRVFFHRPSLVTILDKSNHRSVTSRVKLSLSPFLNIWDQFL